MQNKLSVLVLFIFIVITGYANEVLVCNVYKSHSVITRVESDNENTYPTGYFFKGPVCSGFFVDKFKNFRFYIIRQNTDYTPNNRPLQRQIFDLNQDISNYGLNGKILHDERGKIIPNAILQPVYRPEGSFCSVGLGKEINENFVTLTDKHQAPKIFENKKWYQIPNGSWYQTWFEIKCKNNINKTYTVFFDNEEIATNTLIEQFWRGEHPGLALEKKIAYLNTFKLKRAKVSGALELLPNTKKQLITVWKDNEKFTISHMINKTNKNGYNVIFYKWFNNKKGKINLNFNKNFSINELSNDLKKRILTYNYNKFGNLQIYIIGPDTIKNWLKILKVKLNNFNPNIIKACNQNETQQIKIYAYDKSKGILLSLSILNNKPLNANIYKLPAQINCLQIVNNQYVYFTLSKSTSKELENLEFDNATLKQIPKINNTKNDEIIEKLAKVTLTTASGRIILSESFYLNVYKFNIETKATQQISNIFLGKKYFEQKFKARNMKANILYINNFTLYKSLKLKNAIIPKISTNVQDYPNSYKPLQKTLIAVYKSNFK